MAFYDAECGFHDTIAIQRQIMFVSKPRRSDNKLNIYVAVV